MFIETTLIIEGALEETQTWDNDKQVEAYVIALKAEHKHIHAETPWEVYTIRHEHEPGIECECVQYEQAHKPAYSIAG